MYVACYRVANTDMHALHAICKQWWYYDDDEDDADDDDDSGDIDDDEDDYYHNATTDTSIQQTEQTNVKLSKNKQMLQIFLKYTSVSINIVFQAWKSAFRLHWHHAHIVWSHFYLYIVLVRISLCHNQLICPAACCTAGNCTKK